MIANEQQHQVAQNKIAELTDLASGIERGTAGDGGFEDLQAEALAVTIEALRAEMTE